MSLIQTDEDGFCLELTEASEEVYALRDAIAAGAEELEATKAILEDCKSWIESSRNEMRGTASPADIALRDQEHDRAGARLVRRIEVRLQKPKNGRES